MATNFKTLMAAMVGMAIACGVAQAQAPQKQPAQTPRTPLPAQAQPNAPDPSPAALALARELLVLKKATAVYQNIVPAVVQRTKDQLMQTNLNLQKDLNEVAIKIVGDMSGRRNDIGEAMAKIYTLTFSEQELKELIVFYKSPLGQKFVELEPRAINASLQFMNEWAVSFGDEVNAKFKTEMKARGKDF